MKIKKRSMGPVQSNTYYLEKDNQVIVIDPCLDLGYDANQLLEPIKDKHVIAVLITHGHLDHISGIDAVCKTFNCPVYIHESESEWLKQPRLNLSFGSSEPVVIETKPIEIALGKLIIDNFEFDVIATPGHTKGSVSYVIDQYIFNGDFIFRDSIGRMDLPTGSERDMIQSLSWFVTEYRNANPTLYPGHGDKTTLKREIQTNPFINHYLK